MPDTSIVSILCLPAEQLGGACLTTRNQGSVHTAQTAQPADYPATLTHRHQHHSHPLQYTQALQGASCAQSRHQGFKQTLCAVRGYAADRVATQVICAAHWAGLHRPATSTRTEGDSCRCYSQGQGGYTRDQGGGQQGPADRQQQGLANTTVSAGVRGDGASGAQASHGRRVETIRMQVSLLYKLPHQLLLHSLATFPMRIETDVSCVRLTLWCIG